MSLHGFTKGTAAPFPLARGRGDDEISERFKRNNGRPTKKRLAWGWWLVKNYVVLGPHAPWIDLLKPLWLVYAKQSTGVRERPRRAQARTSLLYEHPIHPHHPAHTLMLFFFGVGGGSTEIQISLSPLSSLSSMLPPSSSFSSLASSFLLFLPCKDNQVYVKYVCSFDSRRYLINSITPSTIVPKVFEMRTGEGGLF